MASLSEENYNPEESKLKELMVKLKDTISKNKIIWLGIILSLFYWFIESIIHVYIFKTNEDFFQELFTEDINELFMRIVVVCLILLLSILGQYLIINQKEIVQKLKESEEKYKNISNELEIILDLIPGLLFCKDRNGIVTRVNQNFAEFLRMKKEDIIGKTSFDLFPEEQARKFREDDLEVINSGIPKLNIEESADTPGGKTWVITSKAPQFNEEGKTIGIIGLAIDITERKETERKLKESEEKWRAITKYTPDHIWVIDTNYKLTFVNYTVPDLSVDEVIGNHYSNFVQKEYLEQHEEILKEIMETGKTIRWETGYLDNYGKQLYFDVHSGPIFKEGKVIGIVTRSTDITERRKKEEELRLHSEMMENMNEGVNLIRASDLLIVYANPRFEEMFGYDPSEIIGKHASIINAPSEKSPEETAKDIEAIMEERGEWQGEIQNIKKDGTLLWCFANVSSFDHPEYGKVFVSIFTDISERKKAKEEITNLAKFPSENPYPVLRVNGSKVIYANKSGKYLLDIELNDEIPNIIRKEVDKAFESKIIIDLDIELKNRIYTFTITPIANNNYVNLYGMDITELKHKEENLKEVNKLKSEFLRRASHELKTPLISIKGFSDLILSLYTNQLDPVIISKLREINDGCERLQNIINNLLKASRLESPELKPKVQKEEISFLIKFCVHELESLAKTRKQSIKLDIHNELYANIEKEEIHDVLSNLLTNAIKYTPPNGKIEIKSEIKKDFVVVSVKDNGIGFTKDQKTKIFQQFGKIERYGQGLDLGIDGTGLGLYISKRIVESHGGKIWMESEGKSRGSTFYFTLPTAK